MYSSKIKSFFFKKLRDYKSRKNITYLKNFPLIFYFISFCIEFRDNIYNLFVAKLLKAICVTKFDSTFLVKLINSEKKH